MKRLEPKDGKWYIAIVTQNIKESVVNKSFRKNQKIKVMYFQFLTNRPTYIHFTTKGIHFIDAKFLKPIMEVKNGNNIFK